MRKQKKILVAVVLVFLSGVALADRCDWYAEGREPERGCDQAGQATATAPPSKAKGDYAVGTYSSDKGDDKFIGIIDPPNSSHFPEVTIAGQKQTSLQRYQNYYPKLQILKDGLPFKEAEDWLCSQVEVKKDVPVHTGVGGLYISYANFYVFKGQTYKPGYAHGQDVDANCESWKGPSTKARAGQAASPPQKTVDNPLQYPPNMSGLLGDCLKQVTGDTGQNKPKYAAGTASADWQAAFDSDWKEATRGSGAYQQRMLAQGNVWVEGRGWVEGRTIQGEQQTCVSNHLKEQIVRLSSNLSPEQQLMIGNIARQIMAEGDPAARMAQLQRLRQGTFLTISADADRAQSEIHQLEATGVVLDTVTMAVPLVNDGRAFYEMCSGKDAWTGRELAWWERALNGGGLLLGYGTALKEYMNVARPMEEALQAGKMTAQEAKLLDEAIKSGKGLEEAKSLVPYYEAREAAAGGIRKEAAGKVEEYVAAVKSRDADRIRKAVVELKGDRQAITLLNNEGNFVKKKFNDEIKKVYEEVDEEVKKRVAEHYNRKIAQAGKDQRFVPNQAHGVAGATVSADAARAGKGIRPDDISIFSASNPSKSVKVGRDRDYTIRIFGQDVPSKEARQIYEQAMFETMQSKGMLPRGVKTSRQLGEKLDQTAVHWLDAEAYNRKDLSVVLNPAEKGVPVTERRVMRDVRQVADTMEFKGVENFAKADEYRRLGKLGQAEESMMEGMYQIRKQFDNQLIGRVDAARSRGLIDFSKVKISPDLRDAISQARQAGNEGLVRSLELQVMLPDKLRKQIDILRKVEQDGWSPARAEAALKQVFQATPGDVARQLKEATTEWEMRIMSKGR